MLFVIRTFTFNFKYALEYSCIDYWLSMAPAATCGVCTLVRNYCVDTSLHILSHALVHAGRTVSESKKSSMSLPFVKTVAV